MVVHQWRFAPGIVEKIAGFGLEQAVVGADPGISILILQKGMGKLQVVLIVHGHGLKNAILIEIISVTICP